MPHIGGREVEFRSEDTTRTRTMTSRIHHARARRDFIRTQTSSSIKPFPAPDMRHATLLFSLLLGLLMILGAGCAAPQKEADLVWPLPPEKPRIKYLYAIASSDDVKEETLGRKVKNVVIGQDPSSRLVKPYAVHVDKNDRVFVADSSWGKVLMFDRKGHKFSVLGLDGQGILAKPLGVATDAEGKIYVTDTAQNRVVVYDKDGEYLSAIGALGTFDQPVGIGINDTLGRVYVVDTKKHNVQVFDKNDGNPLFSFGQRGTEDGNFNMPTNIEIGPDGKVYVMDTFNFRAQIFDADGKFLNKFGAVGTGFGHFSKPKGIALDNEGHIYVADAAFNNVQIFNPEGEILLFFGEFGNKPGYFWLPAGMDIDSQNRIYVADQYNRRINVYQFLGGEE